MKLHYKYYLDEKKWKIKLGKWEIESRCYESLWIKKINNNNKLWDFWEDFDTIEYWFNMPFFKNENIFRVTYFAFTFFKYI